MGAFEWARRALNSQIRRFAARLAQLMPSVQPFLSLRIPAAVSSDARDCGADTSPCPRAGGLQTVVSGEVLDAKAHVFRTLAD